MEFKFTMNSYRRIIVGSPKNRIYCDEFFDFSLISIECASVTRLFYKSSVAMKYSIKFLSKPFTFSIQVQRNSKQKPHNHTIWCKYKYMKSRKKNLSLIQVNYFSQTTRKKKTRTSINTKVPPLAWRNCTIISLWIAKALLNIIIHFCAWNKESKRHLCIYFYFIEIAFNVINFFPNPLHLCHSLSPSYPEWNFFQP